MLPTIFAAPLPFRSLTCESTTLRCYSERGFTCSRLLLLTISKLWLRAKKKFFFFEDTSSHWPILPPLSHTSEAGCVTTLHLTLRISQQRGTLPAFFVPVPRVCTSSAVTPHIQKLFSAGAHGPSPPSAIVSPNRPSLPHLLCHFDLYVHPSRCATSSRHHRASVRKAAA